MEKALKKECNKQGAALLIYRLAMSAVVTVVALVITMVKMIRNFGKLGSVEGLLEFMTDTLAQSTASGWGYLVCITLGTVAILLWKKPAFFRHEILKQGKPMGIGSFFIILCLFMGAQLASQIGLMVMDGIFGLFGKSMSSFMETAGVNTADASMWLYAGLGAPIFEELLFRGVMLRSLEPYGKRLSILVTSILFGFFHGNPVQAPYAALVGMVLGYVAMEHNIVWAMVLHLFNNLLFADSFGRLLQGLPLMTQNLIVYGVMIVFAVAAILLLVVKRRQVAEAIRRDVIQPWQYNGAFLSPLLLVCIAFCVFDMILFVGMMLLL